VRVVLNWGLALMSLALTACSAIGAPATVIGSSAVDPKVTSAVMVGGGSTESILSCASKRIDYTPIPPLPAGGYTRIEIDATGKLVTPVLKAWPEDAASVNKLLTNISTEITQSDLDVSGSVASIFGASHSHRQYVIDFMKWRAEPLTYTTGGASTSMGWVRVGAGLRLVVDITKNDGSASGSLQALAANVKAGKVEGSISTELIGLDASEVTQAMPFTVDLSEGNIQKVVEALALVKAKLYDSKATLYPNLIARIECGSQAQKQEKR
jgi:hypothetical protein